MNRVSCDLLVSLVSARVGTMGITGVQAMGVCGPGRSAPRPAEVGPGDGLVFTVTVLFNGIDWVAVGDAVHEWRGVCPSLRILVTCSANVGYLELTD